MPDFQNGYRGNATLQDGIDLGAGFDDEIALLESVRVPGNALADLPAPGVPVALWQNAGFPLATAGGPDSLNSTLLVPLPQAIASRSCGTAGTSARPLSVIRTLALQP